MARKLGESTDKATFQALFNEDYPLSHGQAGRLLEKHNLGEVATLTKLRGNFINSVFECLTTCGNSYILKIRFRPGQQAPDIEQSIAALLKDVLPVASLYLLDEDRADGMYRNPEYVEASFTAYETAGGKRFEISEVERVLRDVILKANGGRWWWDGARVLHPNTSKILGDILNGLGWIIKTYAH